MVSALPRQAVSQAFLTQKSRAPDRLNRRTTSLRKSGHRSRDIGQVRECFLFRSQCDIFGHPGRQESNLLLSSSNFAT
jgi:hypothetical protein